MIDVVIPTYNRLWALRRVAAFYLLREGVRRVIVVDVASTDGTGEWLRTEAEREPRLIPMSHERNRGASAARNTGADVAMAPFVFFADVDMLFTPGDSLSFMLGELEAQKADIAAPVHVLPETSKDLTLPAVVPSSTSSPRALYHRHTLELRSRAVVAGWELPPSFGASLGGAWMLMRRAVLETVRYDESLGVTGYRDETDFQLKALTHGHRMIACARPVMIDLARVNDNGGCHSTSRAEYVWRACRNNWRILVRHREVIRNRLGIGAPISYLQLCFVGEHAIALGRNYIGRLLR